jgi:hypothetical protein
VSLPLLHRRGFGGTDETDLSKSVLLPAIINPPLWYSYARLSTASTIQLSASHRPRRSRLQQASGKLTTSLHPPSAFGAASGGVSSSPASADGRSVLVGDFVQLRYASLKGWDIPGVSVNTSEETPCGFTTADPIIGFRPLQR